MYTDKLIDYGLAQLNTFRGMRVITDDTNMVDHHEDWSDVRSPSRAKRRIGKHKQRVKFWTTPRKDLLVSDTMLIGHSQTILALKLATELENVGTDNFFHG